MVDRVDVAVVGGGIAGLTAAALVARAGRSVVVLEKASEAGGRGRSRTMDGFTFNLGPHAVYRRGPGLAVLETLGVRLQGAPPASGYRAEYEGSEDRLPVDASSLLTTSLLPVRDKIQVAPLLATLPRLDPEPLDAVTVTAWLEPLRPAARALMRAMVRLATYVDDPDRQSAGAAVRQLQDAMAAGVLYLDGGWQQLVDALGAAARDSGATVRTHAGAQRVRRGATGLVVELDGATLEADAVLLAVPPDAAARLTEAPSLARAAAAAVPSRAACLDVALRRLPRPDRPFLLGLDQPSYASVHSLAARLAPAGQALVHLARYGGGNDTRPQLEGLLDRLQPGWREEVVHARFVPDLLVTHDIVRAEAGGLAGRAPIAVPELPGVLLAGDWVGPEGQLVHASLASARAAAEEAVRRTAAARAA